MERCVENKFHLIMVMVKFMLQLQVEVMVMEMELTFHMNGLKMVQVIQQLIQLGEIEIQDTIQLLRQMI